MSTSEYRSVDAESDLPISAAEIAALATQLYAASVRPGPDSPPQAVPVAPRGSVPDTTARHLGRTDRGGHRRSAPGAGSAAWRRRHLRSGSDVSRTRTPTADGAGRPARQRARCNGGAVGRLDHRRCGGSLPAARRRRPQRVRGAHRGHRPDAARCAGRGAAERSGGSAWFGAHPGLDWLSGAPSVPDLGWSDGVPAGPEALMRRSETSPTTTS